MGIPDWSRSPAVGEKDPRPCVARRGNQDTPIEPRSDATHKIDAMLFLEEVVTRISQNVPFLYLEIKCRISRLVKLPQESCCGALSVLPCKEVENPQALSALAVLLLGICDA